MGVKYEVTAVTGTYTDKSGNEKRRYRQIGVVLDTKHGQMIKIESIPVNWDGIAYLNEPKEREAPQPRGAADLNDDPPF